MTLNTLKTLFLSIFFVISFAVSTEEPSAAQLQLLEQLPPDQRAAIMGKMDSASSLQAEIEETFEEANTLVTKPELKDLSESEEYCADCIYGYNFR